MLRLIALLLIVLTATLPLTRPSVAAVPRTTSPSRPAPLPTVREAWIRWLPASLPEGGYLTLVNSTDRAQVLVGASSPDFASVQVHQSRNVHGTESMVPVPRLAIPAHSTLDFAAHGFHLMLMRPLASVRPGVQVPVTLRFADGAETTVEFEVRAPTAGAQTAPSGSQGSSEPGMAGMPGMPGMPGH